jgi:hypothetical protein
MGPLVETGLLFFRHSPLVLIKHLVNVINDKAILIGKQISNGGFPRTRRASHPQNVSKLVFQISHHPALSE